MRSKRREIVSFYNWLITTTEFVVNWFEKQQTSARLRQLFLVCSRLMFHESHACVKNKTVHMHIPFRISDVFNSPLDRRKINCPEDSMKYTNSVLRMSNWTPTYVHQVISFILWQQKKAVRSCIRSDRYFEIGTESRELRHTLNIRALNLRHEHKHMSASSREVSYKVRFMR
jgi:hypothetical protein